MKDDPPNLTLEELTKIITAVNREARELLNELAACFATFRRRHNIRAGEFLIIDQSLYDDLPFKPNWVKGTRMFPSDITSYILRRPDLWQ